MTWSIIARDQTTGRLGIAVASRFFAVGALVPHVKSGIGAIATQALVNSFYGTVGLRLLEEGRSAPDVVSAVIAADPGREHRQVHAMGLQRPHRRPYRKRLRSLVWTSRRGKYLGRGQHARRCQGP